MIKKIKEAVRLQKTLNDRTNDIIWIFGINKFNKDVNWGRTIFMEAAEMIESFPWKHWKSIKGTVDIDNARVEHTDIFHFLLSYGISATMLSTLQTIKFDLKKESMNEENVLDIDLFNQKIEFNEFSSLLKRLDNDKEQIVEAQYNSLFDKVEDKIVEILMDSFVNKKNKEIDLLVKIELLLEVAVKASLEENNKGRMQLANKMSFFKSMTDLFVDILDDLNFNLFGLYLGKNVLNQFRQDNGYKEGTYIKIWNKKEDNVYMTEIVNQLGDNVSYEEIYNKLNMIYKSL